MALRLLQVAVDQILRLIQPILVPVCFVLAWTVVGLSLWSIWSALRDSVLRARQMHRIPCSQCRYFSGNYALKCPVRPCEALSEAAIDCPDYEPTGMGLSTQARV
ncbi:MAG: hypothetical protein AAGH78_07985 [Cyanobacteria bacterium P01_H01_bin.58]